MSETKDGGAAHGFEARPAPNGGWILLNYRSYLNGNRTEPIAAFSSPAEMLGWLSRELLPSSQQVDVELPLAVTVSMKDAVVTAAFDSDEDAETAFERLGGFLAHRSKGREGA